MSADDSTAQVTSELSDLAQRFQSHHLQVQQHLADAKKGAADAGDVLWRAKEKLQHGQWLPWLKEHCQVATRTAQQYMQIAKNYSLVSRQPGFAEMTLQEVAQFAGKARRCHSRKAHADALSENRPEIEAPQAKRRPMSEKEFDRRLNEIKADYIKMRRAELDAMERGEIDWLGADDDTDERR
jgi:hypothetical protein